MITDRMHLNRRLQIQGIARGGSVRTLHQAKGARAAAPRPDIGSRDGHPGTMYLRVPWTL
jgi:hypothetical protein